jgi:hypothetical protein
VSAGVAIGAAALLAMLGADGEPLLEPATIRVVDRPMEIER